MKNVFKLLVVSVAVCIAALGFYISVNFEGKDWALCVLNDVESLARAELPEVVIECGKVESTGRCWKGTCEPFYTPFGFAKAWECDEPTGNPNDVCVTGAPC